MRLLCVCEHTAVAHQHFAKQDYNKCCQSLHNNIDHVDFKPYDCENVESCRETTPTTTQTV